MEPGIVRTLLLAVLALPLVGALVTAYAGAGSRGRSRGVALGFALLHVALTGVMIAGAYPALTSEERSAAGRPTFLPEFVPGATDENPHATTWDLLDVGGHNLDGASRGVQFFVGLDGLNLWLVALASFMAVPAVLGSWGAVETKANQFYAWILALQGAAVGFFLSFDIVLSYVFFELTLLPMFFLIGVWGVGPGRREAARKFVLYTLAGSLITLVGVVGAVILVYQSGDGGPRLVTFSLPELTERLNEIYGAAAGTDDAGYWRTMQYVLLLTLAAGFAVKVPLVPLHSWLPTAYGESPTGVVIYLSSVLAKMGTFGLLRVALPLAPGAAMDTGLDLLGLLAAVGIIYGALCAFAQDDVKQMVAYGSVSHLGFCVLGLLAFNTAGVSGGVLHMVNHGLATGALFLLAGLLFDRYRTQKMSDYGGLMNRLPLLSFFMMVICLANIGVPGLNNFVSEMLMLGGLFGLDSVAPDEGGFALAAAAAFGIFLSAWYILTMLRNVFFGELKEPVATARELPAPDLRGRELAGAIPLALLCVVLGCVPGPVLKAIEPDAEAVARLADAADPSDEQE